MNYITDENKNITHVVIEIEEWNELQQRLGDTHTFNPYSQVLDAIREIDNELSIDKLFIKKIGYQVDIPKHPAFGYLMYLLDNEILPIESNTFAFSKDKAVNLRQIYSWGRKPDPVSIAVAYIIRSDDFYKSFMQALNGQNVSNDLQKKYGFDYNSFEGSVGKEWIQGWKEDSHDMMIFRLYPMIVDFFNLSTVQGKRLRTEAELNRLVIFDLMKAQEKLVSQVPALKSIFDKYPLVDSLAKVFFSDNTLSGATSRIYKAKKEASKYISGGWKEYVSFP